MIRGVNFASSLSVALLEDKEPLLTDCDKCILV